MGVHAYSARRHASQPPVLQVATLPSPMRGMDGRQVLGAHDPAQALLSVNIGPDDEGFRTRPGHREWATNLEDVSTAGVRTLLPFDSTSETKLFAATNEGIWDVTAQTSSPVKMHTFADTGGSCGCGSFVHVTSDANVTYLYYTDEQNGLVRYNPSLDAWETNIGITGPAGGEADFVYVMLHKNRLWFVERGSATGWYLPAGALIGTATPFYFGSKFVHGGDLLGLFNWSIDGGAGLDDYLVAISRAGDVIPYQGSDPAQASTWEVVGSFAVGEMPAGRRCAGEHGGRLYIVSTYGLTSMRSVLRGHGSTIQEDAEEELVQKLGRYLREDVAALRTAMGWEIRMLPNLGGAVILTPPRDYGAPWRQYFLSFTAGGWHYWGDVPANTAEPWQGATMVGTPDGRVLRMDTTLDNVTLAEPSKGDPIYFTLLQNFTDLGQPGRYKVVEHIRPNWVSPREPGYAAWASYDYAYLAQDLGAGIPPFVAPSGDFWDDPAALWDLAVWGSRQNQSFARLIGASGQGRSAGIGLQGQAYARAVLVNLDIMWRTGGGV